MSIFRRIARNVALHTFSTVRILAAWPTFAHSYLQYRQLATGEWQPRLNDLQPCLGDNVSQTPVDAIYFYQDAWAFEKIVQLRPAWVVDVGSHHKYVSLLSKVVPTTMVDIRPLPTPLNTLTFRQGSILELPYEDGSVPCVSSMCVIEHIGLGRYGDPLDADGSVKALHELKRVVQPGGDLVLSVPIDNRNRTYFNAHRAFQEEYLLELFAPFAVLEKRYIYGKTFGEEKQSGFGVGCYHLHQVS